MILALASLLLLSADGDYAKVDEIDGIVIESRPVASSSFVELRLTTTTDKTPTSLCDAAYGDGKFDPEEPDLKSRTILEESADERVTYDQISPAVVSNRDYAVRAKRVRAGDGSCAMIFAAANDKAPPLPKGWVRIVKLHGSWTFTPLPEGKTKVVYVIHSDPGGSIPAFFVEGARRKIAVRWVKMILSRGKTG
ncbi:MAG: START domain-containing protein [Myxococcota bacterium]